MILIIYILTPFTMTHSIHLFQGFRIIQTRMMVLTILHGLRPNPKLKSILEGCTDLQHLWGTTLHSHNLFSRQFFLPQRVYIRFTHIQNMQPKFYLGSAMHHTLDREYSRSRKYFQLTHERLVQAELALRYWHEHDNLYIWAPIPIYTDRVDYRSLEAALIQEWQPRLNYPFICQFYHPKKGLQKNPSQYQCTIWPCHPLASCQTQIHSTLGSPSPDVITVSKPSRTLDHCPRLRIKYQGEIRTNKDASIQRWRSSFVLCPSPASQQHSGAFSDIVPDRHRCNHQMVARKTRPQGISLKSTLVPFSKSSITAEEISSRCWTTRYLAILLPSKQSLSNIRLSWTLQSQTGN